MSRIDIIINHIHIEKMLSIMDKFKWHQRTDINAKVS